MSEILGRVALSSLRGCLPKYIAHSLYRKEWLNRKKNEGKDIALFKGNRATIVC